MVISIFKYTKTLIMIKFKDYNQGQTSLFPLNISELVPVGHLARVINSFVDGLDPKILQSAFSAEGCPSYHPVMMLKVLIYAYTTRVFSSRDIELHLKQDVVFMWLSGMQTPDHNTINRFRGDYLSDVLDEVFFQVVWMLKEKGFISLKDLFVDGTKMEANAGKYTHVWRKNTERYKKGVREKIALLLEEINEINKKEDKEQGEASKQELTIGDLVADDELKAAATEANEQLKKKIKSTGKTKKTRTLKKKSRELEENIGKLNKYIEQEELLGKRNSYSKIDVDATFMRDKSNLLRPCYNPIISTENQFAVNITVSQNAADNVGFKEHLQKLLLWNDGILKPDNYMGDAGFGNEETYSVLEKESINSFLKFNTFHYEKTDKFKENIFHPENMLYDANSDSYICPADRKIKMIGYDERSTATGYVAKLKIYECDDCSNCSFVDKCKKSKGNRRFAKSEKLEKFKNQVRTNLNSAKGIELRKRRGPDVETPFGDIKHNMGIRKLKLRGIKKVTLELLWIFLAHNLRKAAIMELNAV